LLAYLKSVDRSIVRPTVILPSQGSFTDAVAEANIPVVIVEHGSWVSERQQFVKLATRCVRQTLLSARAYVMLRDRFRNESVDLIYSNTIVSPVGALLAQVKNCPHLWHVRESIEDIDGIYNWGTRRSMHFVDKNTTTIICNSQATQSKLAAYIPKEKLKVIYNGFPELEQFASAKREPILTDRRVRLGIVGYVKPYKGHLLAVRALSGIVEQGIDAELVIAGIGTLDYIDAIKELARKLRIDDRIIWKGFLNDITEMYNNIDILLVCSKAEPFGRTVVEALAHGCPVVGPNSGGLPEIIQDEYNGLLYEAEDARSLSECILRLIHSAPLYEGISARAYCSVYPRFSVSRYAKNITETIEYAVTHNLH